jgi:hypothetical protein
VSPFLFLAPVVSIVVLALKTIFITVVPACKKEVPVETGSCLSRKKTWEGIGSIQNYLQKDKKLKKKRIFRGNKKIKNLRQ